MQQAARMMMQAGIVCWLAEPRIERVFRQVRSDLGKLRRRQLSFLASLGKPGRNADLDPFVYLLGILRTDYDLQIRALEERDGDEAPEPTVLARARAISRDVDEIIDLLVWFGGKTSTGPEIGAQPAGA